MQRHTSQTLLPSRKPNRPSTQAGQPAYDLYPAHPLPPGLIDCGYAALAKQLKGHPVIVIDGFPGTDWPGLVAGLTEAGLAADWQSIDQALLHSPELEAVVGPFLGGDDPLFGKRFDHGLRALFDSERLAAIQPSTGSRCTILFGCGAGLCEHWLHDSTAALVYVDLPKNELQFRARAKQPTNIGVPVPLPARAAYKRSYFVDWPAANAHKAALMQRVDWFVDGQLMDEPAFMRGETLRSALAEQARTVFRARPWFEPGAWGGQWIKKQVPELPGDVPNYAWSFELITPENGLLFQSDGKLLEASFDCLMALHSGEVLGKAAERFGADFPIRFDWLDTVEGGNLSVQCHPSNAYAKNHFGEPFTQDETYYMLHAEPGSEVYLGFAAGVEPGALGAALHSSADTGTPLAIERFVQKHPARTGDLFLIPNGTVHCAGAGCVVLEISATPYIFTFKMYDWMRLDLDGKPRTLNIDRALANLHFERAGDRVRNELISQPRVLNSGPDWQIEHLPTHPDHFYDIHRLTLHGSLPMRNSGCCHVLAVVDGPGVRLTTDAGYTAQFAFAETFVVPAAAGGYTLTPLDSNARVTLVQAFVRPAAA